MRTTIQLFAVAAAVATTVNAFTNTYPLIAWSNQPLKALEELSPTHPSNTPSVFRPAPQTPFPASSDAHDLCSLASVLFLAVPGLHSSDLALLPASEGGIRAVMQGGMDESNSVNLPYLPLTASGQAGHAAHNLALKFVRECGAVVEQSGVASFWGGEQGKSVKVEVVEGLEDWQLTGTHARSMRRRIMEGLDNLVQGHLHALQSPYLIVLTSAPASSLSSLSNLSKAALAKRQYYESVADDFGSEEAFEAMYEGMIAAQAIAPKANASKSIFAVKEDSGLLHRYVFFTAPLVLALLITLLIFIPLAVFSTQALTTTQTVAGLEAKMTGAVGLDAAKSG